MKDLNFDIKGAVAQAKKISKQLIKHASFIAVMLVLVAYLVVVWKISGLASTEPTMESAQAAASNIPKIDKNAVKQIQALEENNTQVHSLFNQARTNPFQE
jgi:hypothetical protein